MLNQSTVTMAPQEISGEVLQEKYAKGNEVSVLDVRQRVGAHLRVREVEREIRPRLRGLARRPSRDSNGP